MSKNTSQYQLTQAEQNTLKRLAKLQRESMTTKTPRVLTVFVTDGTLSYFEGNPAGATRSDKKRP